MVSGRLEALADGRYRGVSLNDGGPVARARLSVPGRGGGFVDLFATPDDVTGGSRLEVSNGMSHDLPGAPTVTAGRLGHIYPDPLAASHVEVLASPSQTFFVFTRRSRRTGRHRNRARDSLHGRQRRTPQSPCSEPPGGRRADDALTLSAGLGYETEALDDDRRGGKLDWTLGASALVRGVGVGLG